MSNLTEAEKVDARRFCGYPAYGAALQGMQSWRFFQIYGIFEFRLNNMSDLEVGILRRYLTTLTAMEVSIPDAASNLDTDEAMVWKRNRDELGDRSRLFDDWRLRLCGFMGVPAGPALSSGAGVLVV